LPDGAGALIRPTDNSFSVYSIDVILWLMEGIKGFIIDELNFILLLKQQQYI